MKELHSMPANRVATLCAWCGAELAPGRMPAALASVGLASHGLCRDCGADLLCSVDAVEAAGLTDNTAMEDVYWNEVVDNNATY